MTVDSRKVRGLGWMFGYGWKWGEGWICTQGEDYVRICIHVCIRGMVFVQKGNWSFRIAELVSLCIERGGRRFWLRLWKVEMVWGRDGELAPGSCTGWRLWGFFAVHIWREVFYSYDTWWKWIKWIKMMRQFSTVINITVLKEVTGQSRGFW